MPPSQLKRLKSTLREQGIVGPQKTKKQRKKDALNGANKKKLLTREVALTDIREQFNPFEYRACIPKKKFESITQKTSKALVKRPGLIKSRDEQTRRNAYFEEQERKKKVGGILDKRFGENDPTLAIEEKMLQRFTREKQLSYKNNSIFDLEDAELSGELTHMGRALSLDNQPLVDDYQEGDLQLSDSEAHLYQNDQKSAKRSWTDRNDGGDSLEDVNAQQRKKSKQEIMKEVIAKSKLHKYERQAAKDEDEDLREELDKQMVDIHGILREINPKLKQDSDPSGIAGNIRKDINKTKLDKDYDTRLRQLALDKRSMPTEKSKTEDEILAERVSKLQELESERLRRMQGKSDNSENEDEKIVGNSDADEDNEDFGLGDGIKARFSNGDLAVEDEDEFIIDNNLVASGSDMEIMEVNESDTNTENFGWSDSDDELLTEVFKEEDPKLLEQPLVPNTDTTQNAISDKNTSENLSYHFSCPQSHEEFLKITENLKVHDLPTVVRRIRVLYSPKLQSENKIKLGNFSVALVDHVSHLANQEVKPPFKILEALIRHIHSLSKTFPIEIANSFRSHLKDLNLNRALSPTAGDLILLTAIGVVFPTSDHFHQVVTPAMLSMTRYLGLKTPEYLNEYAIGSYLCTLCIHYQRISGRFIPEVMNFIQNTLCVLAPIKMSNLSREFPYHKPKQSLRFKSCKESPKKLEFYDFIQERKITEGDEKEVMKISLINVNLKLLDAAADIWSNKEAFTEIFQPPLDIIKQLTCTESPLHCQKSTQMILDQVIQKLSMLLSQSKISRRPLELHHHRPLAIKTSIPKFEESFNPERHYDPDKTRTEIAKLKKEHKREKKGTIRELRKDARTHAIQSLKEKKERDAAYEKKYKRLIAEIQSEEGKEANAYEREKEMRKKSRK
ncbi:putative nucleolar complex protein 14 [Erysiphe neolycopersici]|uniref:Putative nucleolar complex protein 14 n=1 Tax=Erysiphe neolycopersici TaxID=212602 RepID=A0A420I2D4_9PEZI|nr:putative nucleolar complex protein 14 [Erysiphe neolycopersici]